MAASKVTWVIGVKTMHAGRKHLVTVSTYGYDDKYTETRAQLADDWELYCILAARSDGKIVERIRNGDQSCIYVCTSVSERIKSKMIDPDEYGRHASAMIDVASGEQWDENRSGSPRIIDEAKSV